MFHSCQVLENVSCLFCAVRTRSSIRLISSTFCSHKSMDDGSGDFHWSGMQALAVSKRWRITDFLYTLSGIFDACRRKNAGSSVMERSESLCCLVWGMTKKCVSKSLFPSGSANKGLTSQGKTYVKVLGFCTTLIGF